MSPNLKKKIVAIILIAVLLFTSINFALIFSHASTSTWYASINAVSGVNFRSSPEITSSNVIGTISDNVSVELLDYPDTNYVGSGYTWYKVSYSGQVGYIANTYLDNIRTVAVSSDVDFETYLTQQGFPESYKQRLRELHAEYPSWIFIADHTGIDWDDAVYALTNPSSRSLTTISRRDSYKSMRQGDYSFSTNTYIGKDSSSWVSASIQAVEYHLDPRPNLTDPWIFQFLSMEFDSSITQEHLQSVLNGTFMEGALPSTGSSGVRGSTYNDVIYSIGMQYGINPISLAAKIIQEMGASGNSGSRSGSTGYYNYFNINAYGNPDPVANGLAYAKQQGWDTREESIEAGAELFVDYVDRNQHTTYLKKWNVMNGLSNVGTMQYMTNIEGADSEAVSVAKGYADLKDSALVFKIPVYTNMSELPSVQPSSTGNNDYYLTGISITNTSVSPAFSRYTTSYTATVEHYVDSVNITPLLSNSGATTSGAGNVSLAVGSNSIPITVTSTSGISQTYTVTITRESPPPYTATDYAVGEYVKGVQENTSYEVFMMDISNDDIFASNSTWDSERTRIIDKNGNTVTNGMVSTGMTVQFFNSSGAMVKEADIVIKGDVLGTGSVIISGARAIQLDVLGTNKLEGAYAEAAKINNSDSFSIADARAIQLHVLGQSQIKF